MKGRRSPAAKLYDEKWRAARLGFLRLYPWCKLHEARGSWVAATVVDHVIPHRGDRRLFWDRANWQGLCEHCHNSVKQSQENQRSACDASGYPVADGHHWRR
jgi:5-methylcytosine-specific restriction enzyme A